MRNLEWTSIDLLNHQYRAVIDGKGDIFINLTANDIVAGNLIIPRSKHYAYVIDEQFVVGLPQQQKGLYYVVEYSVLRVMNRRDLCIGVRSKEEDGKIYLSPLKEYIPKD